MSGPGVRLHQVEPMCEWKRTLTSHAVRDSGSVRPDSSGDVGYEERSPDAQEVKEVGSLTALTENETHQSYTRDDGERLDEVPDNEVSGDRAPHGSREAGGGKPGDEAYSGEKCVLEERAHERRYALSNGSRLSCGRNTSRRKAVEWQTKRLAGEATQLVPTCERPAASSAC